MAVEVTCTAPVNIAVIKYWGKRNVELNLPTNGSLSVTLSQAHMQTTTTIRADPAYKEDRFWLNGKEEDMSNPRLQVCLRLIREMAAADTNRTTTVPADCRVRICSRNSFPTAAGLASSASGYACLVFTLARVYGLSASVEELSAVARQGSGSACRSLYGGFVAWERGERDDGLDSTAVQVADEAHWPDIHIVVFVVSAERKHVGSTVGMQTTVKTSPLHAHRADAIVPARMKAMKAAIAARDFATFADLTMRDSNQFHAVCLDTFPPVFYLNDTSRALISLVHQYNAAVGEVVAAYTFDAGPNAVVYVHGAKHARDLVDAALALFPPSQAALAQQGGYLLDQTAANAADVTPTVIAQRAADAEGRLADFLASCAPLRRDGALSRIIHTLPGGGPQVLPSSASLLGEDGMPRSS